MTDRVLLLDPELYSDSAKNEVKKVATLVERKMSRVELLTEISHYTAIILRFSHVLDSELLSKATKLRAIATNATGVDHIDLETAEKNNIKIISLKGELEFLRSISSTAELTWGLIINLLRNIPSAISDVKAERWRRDDFLGRDLQGKRLGILGYGRIGTIVGRYAEAFEMEVAYFDDIEKKAPIAFKKMTLESIFEWSDIVSVHLPLTPQTKGIISASLLDSMKRGACLVNTARGQLIDEVALLNALQAKKISAALDVLSNELIFKGSCASPLVEYAKKNTNLIITPHIGGASLDAWHKTENFVCKRLVDFLGKK
jgi:D-3-phosphoglycerate dehydrogenase